MKLVKNVVFAVLLVSALAFNTVAGEIQTPTYVPPPPPPLSAGSDAKTLIPINNTDTQQTGVEASDYLLYEALAALLSVY